MKNKPTLGRLKTLVRISAVFILAHSAFALAQHTYPDFSEGHNEGHKNCSNRTLLGDYGIQLEGTILGPNLPLRTLVLARFNGEGLVTEVDHVVLDGQPPAEEWRPTTGA